VPDPFEPFAGYCHERLVEDPHLWATTLFDELLELGYDRSYPTFTRQWVPKMLRALPLTCPVARAPSPASPFGLRHDQLSAVVRGPCTLIERLVLVADR
jgi:hypothetical protein